MMGTADGPGGVGGSLSDAGGQMENFGGQDGSSPAVDTNDMQNSPSNYFAYDTTGTSPSACDADSDCNHTHGVCTVGPNFTSFSPLPIYLSHQIPTL